MPSSSLSLNVIPLTMPETSKQFSFFKHKPDSVSAVPLNPREIPVGLSDTGKDALYTDFSTHDGADKTITVQFDKTDSLPPITSITR